MVANNFKVDDGKKPANMALLQQAKIVYSADLFITVSMVSIKLVAAETAKPSAKYCLNLSVTPF